MPPRWWNSRERDRTREVPDMPTLPKQLSLLADRVCSVCHVAKSADQYYIKDKRTGRLHSWCKECHGVKRRAWQQGNRERLAELARLSRLKDPEAARRRDAETYRRNAEAIKQRARDRRTRPDVQAQAAEYRASHDAERKAYNAQYRLEHAEQRKDYGQRYYQENKDQATASVRASVAKNPEKYREMRSRWKSENKDAVNASTHKRRAREKSAGSWTQDDWQRLKATYDWRCLGCGKQEMTDGITLCFDHIIPLSMGGWNLISNGQCLCRSCNSLKHRKVLDLRDKTYPFRKRNIP